MVRVRQLQAGNPERLVVLRIISGDRTAERDLHDRFRSTMIREEWFDPSEELLRYIADIPHDDNGDYIEIVKPVSVRGRTGGLIKISKSAGRLTAHVLMDDKQRVEEFNLWDCIEIARPG